MPEAVEQDKHLGVKGISLHETEGEDVFEHLPLENLDPGLGIPDLQPEEDPDEEFITLA